MQLTDSKTTFVSAVLITMTRSGAVWAALFAILALAARSNARGMHPTPGTENVSSSETSKGHAGSVSTHPANTDSGKPSADAANTAGAAPSSSTGPVVVINATTASITVTARNISHQGPSIPMPAAHPHKPFNASSK